MLKLKRIKRERSEIDQLIDEKLKRQLKDAETPEEVAEVVALLFKREEFGNKRRVSADTIAAMACNILGIVLILEYERTHVIASKALGFVIRGRV